MRIAIVGGGLGGLSAAVHLARVGAQVVLIEKEDMLGGKAGERWLGAYRFDTGPSVLTLPAVVESVFRFAGVSLEAYIELVAVDPLTAYFFPDGRKFFIWRNRERMREEFRAWGSTSLQDWERFLRYTRRLYENAAPLFLYQPLHEVRYLLQSRALWRMRNLFLPIDPFRSMYGAIRHYFSDPALIQIAMRYATYNGSDPYQAPATLNLIFWVENGLGVFYVKGGMYRLVEALGRLAQELGVEIRSGTAVHRILHRRGKVIGLETDRGFLPAEVVVSNVDVYTTYEQLLRAPLPKLMRWADSSLSGLVFLWGVRAQTCLPHHTVFFSEDYRQEFESLFRVRKPPPEPTIYVAITSKEDSSHAPQGGENWFVLLNMPAWEGEWPARETQRLREAVLYRLERAVPGLERAKIEEEAVLTPAYWQAMGSKGGSLYGAASNRVWSAFVRPPNRSRRFEGLYFVGGSTHPGGGIPLVLLSGRHVARLISDAYKIVPKNVWQIV
ncbi:MAG: phytoene desaturase family protein [Bacteroidia bacterium]|nr:phytoene desaturase family protein [Bacteroidia bacterium]